MNKALLSIVTGITLISTALFVQLPTNAQAGSVICGKCKQICTNPKNTKEACTNCCTRLCGSTDRDTGKPNCSQSLIAECLAACPQ